MRLLSDISRYAIDRMDEVACHSNVYRATKYWLDEDYTNRRNETSHAALKLSALEKFADLNFDDIRTPAQRRKQLDGIGSVFLGAVAELAEYVRADCRRNLAVQHQLFRARKLFVGTRRPNAAQAFINRSRLKLDYPRQMLGPLMGEPQSRHAIRTALALAEAHEGLRTLLGESYFRRRLYSSTVAKGGALTHWQIAADLGVLGGIVAGARLAAGTSALPAIKVVLAAAACIYAVRLLLVIGKRGFLRPKNDEELARHLTYLIPPDSLRRAMGLPASTPAAIEGGAS